MFQVVAKSRSLEKHEEARENTEGPECGGPIVYVICQVSLGACCREPAAIRASMRMAQVYCSVRISRRTATSHEGAAQDVPRQLEEDAGL